MLFRRASTCPLAVAIIGLTCTSLASPSALAQPANPHDAEIRSLMEMLGHTRIPTEAQISPDGSTVAWSVRTSDGSEIHLSSAIHPSPATEKIVDTGTGATGCTNEQPRWSPDGQSLAFLSNCTTLISNPDQQQLFVWSAKTGEARQLTHVTGNLDEPAWSPDGKSIAFLFVENATRHAGALDAMKPWSGVIGEEGIEVQRVSAIELASGAFRFVTPSNLHVYEFSWAPDSSHVAIVAAQPPGENNWWIAKLYTQSVGSGPAEYAADRDRICGPPRSGTGCGVSRGTGGPITILDPQTISGPLRGLQIAVPRWSPDGKQIAFIGGLMSDQGVTGGDVYLIPATGGEPRDITPGRAASVAYLGWLSDDILGIAEHTGGSTHLTALNIDDGRDIPSAEETLPETIWANELTMSVSAARNHTIAIIRSSFERPPEVWAGRLNELKQITHLNDDLKPLWGKTENIEWTNEGFHVQGWLLYPRNYDPAKKYPLIVEVHGGPSAAVTPRWPSVSYGGVPFSALGYFVFMPNPRGSMGQGEQFTQANIKDFGYGDLRDILAGVDTLEKNLPIDKTREGITGWSYGGFMTMFSVTQTTRFHAAVAGAGISDWKSYYGENSIDQWMIPFFGKSVYDDPAVYAKSSAINYIKNVKTPTLLVVGDRDGECPAPQSFEFWHALKAEGVKTELVVYPDEGHRFRDPGHQRDVLERALEWFETEMPAN
ncbi:peptidase S9 [Edaphobacter acidisoli]|uniref:Peptidase S9 n=1 Tax=Edaphobacter acidisoli TaxID=2040573 RepID=A0A916W9I6_9BACT|nr:S9 family peptidase [Edaphobacter acidisoli]GGA78234.1 peptidase S9 [Edaphobacter acidisoli]